MTKKAKTLLAYTAALEPFYDSVTRRNHLKVRLFSVREESLADLLADCVDNAAGYGSLEAAEQLAREFATLIREGYSVVYDLTSYTFERATAPISLSWQEYDSHSYCGRASTQLGEREIPEFERQIALLKRLEKKTDNRGNENATKFFAALRAVGALRVKSSEGYARHLYLPDTSASIVPIDGPREQRDEIDTPSATH